MSKAVEAAKQKFLAARKKFGTTGKVADLGQLRELYKTLYKFLAEKVVEQECQQEVLQDKARKESSIPVIDEVKERTTENIKEVTKTFTDGVTNVFGGVVDATNRAKDKYNEVLLSREEMDESSKEESNEPEKKDVFLVNETPKMAAIIGAFNLAGLEYKGQMNSAYVETGGSLTTSVTADFGDMVCPGVVELSATAKLTVKITRFVLITLYRQVASEKIAGYEPLGNKTIFFGCFYGGSKKVKAKIVAVAGAGIPIPDELNVLGGETLALALKAKVQADIEYEGGVVRLHDSEPSFHEKYLSSNMTTKFNNIFDWSSLDEIESRLRKLANRLSASLEDNDKKENQKEVFGLNPPKSKIMKFFQTAESKRKELQNSLDKIKGHLNDPSSFREGTILAVLPKDISKEVDEVEKLFGQISRYDPALKLFSFPESELCQFSLWGHAGKAEATVSAEFQADAAGNTLDANATAGLMGGLKFTTYRFQTYHPVSNKDQLVITQDTSINYRQIIMSAEANAKISSNILGEENKEKSTEATYNMMTYKSAIAMWKYPKKSEEKMAQCLQGSGISFGVSVRVTEVSKLKKILGAILVDTTKLEKTKLEEKISNCLKAPNNKRMGSLFNSLKGYLHLSAEELFQYLTNCWVFEEVGSVGGPSVPQELMFPEAVLIESSFAAPIDQTITLNQVKTRELAQTNKETTMYSVDRNFLKTWIEKSSSASQPNKFSLQSIRTRYRIADLQENEMSKFKLGLRLGSGVGIELKDVKNIAVEGIVDLDTMWTEEEGSSPGQAKERYESGVSPVALLHQ